MARQDTQRYTLPPGAAMILVAAGTMGLYLFGLVFGDTQATIAESTRELQAEDLPFEVTEEMMGAFYWAFIAGIFLSCLTVIAAGVAMIKQRAWWLALFGAILTFTPFTWPCCCPIVAGVGIWAIVILAREDVRDSFAGRETRVPPAFEVPPPPTPAAQAEEEDRQDWGSGG